MMKQMNPAPPRLAALLISLLTTAACAVDEVPTPPAANIWPDPKLIQELERKKSPFHFHESDVPKYDLPDPLKCADAAIVTTREQWESKRRPETLELFRRHVYGRSPAPGKVTFDILETDAKAIDGQATRKRIKITCTPEKQGVDSFSFEVNLLTPNRAATRVPAFILINNRPIASADPTRAQKNDFWPVEQIIARGYATAVFRTGDVDPDAAGDAARANGVRAAFHAGVEGEDAWATLAAWAWGASRVLDYLQTDPAIDAAKVAVIGHSRGGKTALWAAAQDTRFALAISNCSGRGGASLARRRMGETVKVINKAFPYWFCDNFKKYDDKEDDLPVDQHQLISLIAPRAVYVASAEADFWADQRGEFLALANANPVFTLYGQPAIKLDEMPPLETPLIRGTRAYHIRRGVHNLTLYDWQRYMDYADTLWPKPATHQ
ncbi:MAG: hypothetical protein JWN40_2276 [Phycisphaerales bacterium]|nr:hypothetical protein [Phycisphaerales bacterium]